MGMNVTDDDKPRHHQQQLTSPRLSIDVHELTQRLNTLFSQLESALSSMLQVQHDAAQTIIPALDSRVVALESLVQSTQSHPLLSVEVTHTLTESHANA